MSNSPPLALKVYGDFACFTRPEFKVERISYDVITPSAARGILEAIFWKPEMSYRIEKIHVLNPIQHFSIWRNEVNNCQSESSAKSWAKTGVGGYFADGDRAQRHTLGLRNVAYLIEAQINLKPHATANIAKYRDQFRRRVQRGQCHHQPYFGTREFSAFFEPPTGQEQAIDRTDELGLMLYDLEFQPAPKGFIQYRQQDAQGRRIISGNARPRFFAARLEQGILTIPPQPL
ncbi:type I-C CRISPR-associated protein Cas5c [Spirulina subsalsa]|uniref:type I-C CRISPR-associated protein Cas5c n=1 Tax=Spirulina subsalsa TaxID=54311 RepID=UPI000310185A|nr:type I-C CRISPR-associated protein Cas5c [Spirulina subsalsa]